MPLKSRELARLAAPRYTAAAFVNEQADLQLEMGSSLRRARLYRKDFLLLLCSSIGRAILKGFRHEGTIDAALTVSVETHGMALRNQSCCTCVRFNFDLSPSPAKVPRLTYTRA
jgi:hypothetical protein